MYIYIYIYIYIHTDTDTDTGIRTCASNFVVLYLIWNAMEAKDAPTVPSSSFIVAFFLESNCKSFHSSNNPFPCPRNNFLSTYLPDHSPTHSYPLPSAFFCSKIDQIFTNKHSGNCKAKSISKYTNQHEWCFVLFFFALGSIFSLIFFLLY